jgi:PAS domain S-box-containing protein
MMIGPQAAQESNAVGAPASPDPCSLPSPKTENGGDDPYRALFDHHPQPMWVVGRETLAVLTLNEAAWRYFGGTPERHGPGTNGEIQPPEDLIHLTRHLDQELQLQRAAGPFPPIAWCYRRKNGTAAAVEITLRPIPFEGREAILILAHDITASRHTEETLRAREQRFRTLVESSSDVVLLLSPDGTILYDAPSPVEVLGHGRDSYIHRNALEWVHPDDQEVLRQKLAALVERPSGPVTVQFRARHRDGSWRWLEATASNLLDEPSIQAIVVNYRDITDRKQVEEALRQSQHRFEVLVNTIEGIVWDADPRTFRFSFVSRQAERLLGYPVERWLTEPNFWEDHLDPRDRTWAVHFSLKAVAARKPYEIEYRMVAADGRVVWLRDLVTVVCADDRPVALRGIMLDITTRKQAEDRLRESEERHRLIAELTSDYTYTCRVDPDGTVRLTSITEGFTRTTGFTEAEAEAPGAELLFLHPEDYALVQQRIQRWLAGERDVGEFRLRTKHGETRWVRYAIQPYRDPSQGRVVGLIGAGQNITERKQAEEALRRLVRRNELILGAAGEGIYGLDREGKTTFVNPAAARMLGWSVSDMIGKNLHRLIHHTRRDGTPYPGEECPIYISVRDGIMRRVTEEVFWRQDGSWFPVEYISTPIWEDGELVGAVVTFSDITERKQVEAKLQENTERLRTLSGQLLEIQELERRHIASELHDEIGQMLTGLQLSLAMAVHLDADQLRSSVAEAQKQVRDLTARVRDMSLRLRPAMLDDLGLLPTLLWHIERYSSQTGVDVVFDHDNLERRLHPRNVETAAYRIVQEALTNVARHAKVREATVRVWLDQDLLCVQVLDDGVGFNPQAVAASASSSGLSGMQERAMVLGGYVTIDSGPGTGTRVTAELPVAGAEERRRANVFDPILGRRPSDRPSRVESDLEPGTGPTVGG